MTAWDSRSSVLETTGHTRVSMNIREAAGRHPLEMHVGGHPPAYWAEAEENGRTGRVPLGAVSAARDGRRWGPSPLAMESFPWTHLGVEPRFVGSETTGCVAALQPGVFHDAGSEEFKRFTTAAARRGETALVVSMIGEDVREDAPRNPLARYDDNILLPDVSGSIVGRRLPVGVNPHLATGVRGADRDLGLRLRNRPPDAPWWASDLRPIHLEGISGTEVRCPSGVLEPILVNDLGEILAGVWVPEGTDWRWYVVPAGTDWRQIVEWLTEHAIPEFLPDALRRVRAADLVDDELLTSREIDARDAMTRFEAATANERARLEGERETARAQQRAGLVRAGSVVRRSTRDVDAESDLHPQGSLRVVVVADSSHDDEGRHQTFAIRDRWGPGDYERHQVSNRASPLRRREPYPLPRSTGKK